jgi:hypothetical protein
VMYYAQEFFDLLMDCTNTVERVRITMKDVYCYHAALVLMTIVRMDKVEYYWYPPRVIEFREGAARLRAYFLID